MPATWPPALPFFVTASRERSGPQDAVIRTQMSAGPDKVRRRTTAAPKRYSGTTPGYTRAELATFETFFADTLDMGALSFTATDPFDGNTKTFRFVGTYSVSPWGKGAQVSAELEILP